MDWSSAVAIVSVLVTGGVAVWTGRQQQRSTDRQLESQRLMAIESHERERRARQDELSWASRVAMLTRLASISQEAMSLEQEDFLTTIVGVDRCLSSMADISSGGVDLWTSREVRHKFAELQNVVADTFHLIGTAEQREIILNTLRDPEKHRRMGYPETDFDDELAARAFVVWRTEALPRLKPNGSIAVAVEALREALHEETH